MNPLLERNFLYSVYFSPRGLSRMLNIGETLAARHLSATDKLVGIIGEAGSGKSLIIKGMFPGLELTNDDNGVNVRPLPILDIADRGFFQAHTYHLDMRFETAFTQIHDLASAVKVALDKGKRVVVEHFEMLYPVLGINAQLLIGVGDELLVVRPTLFGPEPVDVAQIVLSSNQYRRMAHSAEDLTERFLRLQNQTDYTHGDVRHGFLLRFRQKVNIDLYALEAYVKDMVARKLPISYVNDDHIRIGNELHRCTGPRMHMPNTGLIEDFRVYKELIYDELTGEYILVGRVGKEQTDNLHDLNRLQLL